MISSRGPLVGLQQSHRFKLRQRNLTLAYELSEAHVVVALRNGSDRSSPVTVSLPSYS